MKKNPRATSCDIKCLLVAAKLEKKRLNKYEKAAMKKAFLSKKNMTYICKIASEQTKKGLEKYPLDCFCFPCSSFVVFICLRLDVLIDASPHFMLQAFLHLAVSFIKRGC